jgi:hypothetical protein
MQNKRRRAELFDPIPTTKKSQRKAEKKKKEQKAVSQTKEASKQTWQINASSSIQTRIRLTVVLTSCCRGGRGRGTSDFHLALSACESSCTLAFIIANP